MCDQTEVCQSTVWRGVKQHTRGKIPGTRGCALHRPPRPGGGRRPAGGGQAGARRGDEARTATRWATPTGPCLRASNSKCSTK